MKEITMDRIRVFGFAGIVIAGLSTISYFGRNGENYLESITTPAVQEYLATVSGLDSLNGINYTTPEINNAKLVLENRVSELSRIPEISHFLDESRRINRSNNIVDIFSFSGIAGIAALIFGIGAYLEIRTPKGNPRDSFNPASSSTP